MLEKLEGLYLYDLGALHSVDPLRYLRKLRLFALDAGITGTRMRLNSLRSIGRVLSLRKLALGGRLEIASGGFQSLTELQKLSELSVAPCYPLEDLAILASAYPKLCWYTTHPLRRSAASKCRKCGDKKSIPIGKGSKALCERCDFEKVARFVEQFSTLVERHRKQITKRSRRAPLSQSVIVSTAI